MNKLFSVLKRFISDLKWIWYERQHRHNIMIWGSISICIFLISAIFAGYAARKLSILKCARQLLIGFTSSSSTFLSSYLTEIIIGMLVLVLVFVFLLVIGLFYCYLVYKPEPKQTKLPIKNPVSFHSDTSMFYNFCKYFLPFFCFLVFLLIIVLFTGTSDCCNKVFNMFLTNSGGLFAFVTGAFTVIGTYIAIRSIIEMRHTITSYPQLLNRATDLIKNAHENEEVRILSYSPLSGFWQVSSRTLKDSFRKALAENKRKIRIICLDQNNHLKLLLTIAKEREQRGSLNEKISADKLVKFQIQCDKLLEAIQNKPSPFAAETIRLSWGEIPPYYFFVSDHRAIVVTPVGLPNEDEFGSTKILENRIKQYRKKMECLSEIPNELKELVNKIINNKITYERQHSQEYKDKLKDSGAHVQTLGFETTDWSVIDKLQNIFDDLEYTYKVRNNVITSQAGSQTI